MMAKMFVGVRDLNQEAKKGTQLFVRTRWRDSWRAAIVGRGAGANQRPGHALRKNSGRATRPQVRWAFSLTRARVSPADQNERYSQHRWFEAAWFPVRRSCQPRKA